jgi:hypothetical protein
MMSNASTRKSRHGNIRAAFSFLAFSIFEFQHLPAPDYVWRNDPNTEKPPWRNPGRLFLFRAR